MIVVADTSPLNYLVLLGHIEILEKIYAEVVVPQTVLDELQDGDAPAEVRAWFSTPPAWLQVSTLIFRRCQKAGSPLVRENLGILSPYFRIESQSGRQPLVRGIRPVPPPRKFRNRYTVAGLNPSIMSRYPLPEGASCPGNWPRGWVSCALISCPKFLQKLPSVVFNGAGLD
jgi:hypothetical protein